MQKHDLNTAGHLGLGSDTAATFVAMPQLKPHSPVKETMHSMEKPYFIHDIGGAPKRIIRPKNYIADEIRPEASLEPASNQITEAPYRPLNMEEWYISILRSLSHFFFFQACCLLSAILYFIITIG